MLKDPINIKEAYKCPVCKKWLPVCNLVGEVVIYCRHCKKEVKFSVMPVEK